jgi:hypothetical protein
MVPSAFAATEAELQKQIDTLREQIAAVQKLTATPAVLGVTTSNPSVVLSYPNKGEKFAIGEKMTVAWEAKNIPVNSTVCVLLDPVGTEGNFAFPSQGGCSVAKNGKTEISGTLIRNAGYDLKPGAYTIAVKVYGKQSSEKDAPGIASDMADKPITIVETNAVTVATQLRILEKQLQQIDKQIVKLTNQQKELLIKYLALQNQTKG